MFAVYLITDESAQGGLVQAVARALHRCPPHRVAVQLRAKSLPQEELRTAARQLRHITRDAGALLIINGMPALAAAIGADGVQLPEGSMTVALARQQLGPGLVGVSCHDNTGLQRARQQGADFATLSPVFAVPGKGSPLGVEGFARLARGAGLPVYALGGIGPPQVGEVIAAGAAGIAVIRAVGGAEDPSLSLRQLIKRVET